MVTLLAYLSGLALLAAGVALGGPLSGSLNLTAGSLVLGTLVIGVFGHHGVSRVVDAVKAARNPDPDADIAGHYQVLQSLRRMTMMAGAVGGLMGLSVFLRFVADPSQALAVGSGISLALVSMLYGLAVSEMLIGPLCSRLRAQGPADADWDTPSGGLFYGLSALVLAIPFIVMLMHTAFWLMKTATVS